MTFYDVSPHLHLQVDSDGFNVVALPLGTYEDVKNIYISIATDDTVEISNFVIQGCLSGEIFVCSK